MDDEDGVEEVNSVFSRRVSSLSGNVSGTAVPSFGASVTRLASTVLIFFSSVLFPSSGVLRL